MSSVEVVSACRRATAEAGGERISGLGAVRMEYVGKGLAWILVIHVTTKLFLLCACTVERISFCACDVYVAVTFSLSAFDFYSRMNLMISVDSEF